MSRSDRPFPAGPVLTRIADLDELISKQLNEVMHAEAFQKLEGSWRGLHYFVQQTETSSSLKIKLCSA